MSVIDTFMDALKSILESKNISTEYKQYIHVGGGSAGMEHCHDCIYDDLRIFESGKGPKLPRHRFCHCKYEPVKTIKLGTVSKMGMNGVDVYLKTYGKLPDYYITKEEAINVYGWDSSKNTLSGKAPGKMIGGDVYNNDKQKLPVAPGRIWYECDVDYEGGKRNSKRLFYSNDGLMFYSPDHGQKTFYLVV